MHYLLPEILDLYFGITEDEHVFLDDVDRFLQKINGYVIFADGNHENHRALNKFPC